MLIRSAVDAMLMLRNRGDNLFSQLPKELIHVIEHLPTPDNDFLEALHNTAFGELTALKAKLDAAKAKPDKKDLMRLLLQAADVMTPEGKLIKGVTILECALGAGDMEMAEMIKPYFDEFNGGKREFERQRERYRSCIEAMATQQHDYDINWLIEILKKSPQKDVAAELAEGNKFDPTYQSPLRDAMNKFREAMATQQHDYDINWLVEILKKSPQKDVAAELAEGDQFDPTYQSPLRDAMNKFRKDMLDPKRRIISKPRMHCNYKNFDHVDEVLEREWNNLIEGGDNYDKHRLVSCQIYGFMQLIDLPAYERCVHAQQESDAAIAGQAIKRSFDYKYPYALGKTFPVFSEDRLLSHAGVGFGSWVSIYGLGEWQVGGDRPDFQKLCQAKATRGKNFYAAALAATTSPSPSR